jgi:mannose-6-phosphate isomerase-like protein (cupin superfamily)
MKPVRRVVTGFGESGQSTILMDSEIGNVVEDSESTLALAELWSTAESPIDNGGTRDQARPSFELLPDANGSLLRFFEIAPEPAGTAKPGVGAEAHPGFHTTDTLDYIIVLEGEVVAMLEDSETVLRPGDVLIQRGTNHAWSNRSNRPCRMAAVMLDAKPASK